MDLQRQLNCLPLADSLLPRLYAQLHALRSPRSHPIHLPSQRTALHLPGKMVVSWRTVVVW